MLCLNRKPDDGAGPQGQSRIKNICIIECHMLKSDPKDRLHYHCGSTSSGMIVAVPHPLFPASLPGQLVYCLLFQFSRFVLISIASKVADWIFVVAFSFIAYDKPYRCPCRISQRSARKRSKGFLCTNSLPFLNERGN
jgi:hypothetical protein